MYFISIIEEILKEIFERCGEIATIRMSKKNFAHVRFERECYVDNAINLSGIVPFNLKKMFNSRLKIMGNYDGRLPSAVEQPKGRHFRR